MTLECINPADLPIPETYTQVVVARGTKLVFVSGQEPEDMDGKLVGRDDFALQVQQTFANLGRALAAAGALPGQVAKITIYVGVAALSPDYLIEVDAVAVVDG
jgi:enamine deaminase RidA (YjgF/YER057c/UK114 family)